MLHIQLIITTNLDSLDKRPARLVYRTEVELRAAVVDALKRQGIVVGERVVCSAGEPDIITSTRDLIIEVKHQLTRKAVQQAVGQLILYRQSINPQAHLAIAGYPTAETGAFLPQLAALNIDLYIWIDDSESLHNGAAEPLIISTTVQDKSPDTMHRLNWNVQAIARSKGYTKVPQLAWQLGVGRQGVYGIWNGTARHISLDMLGRLAMVLDAKPGDWFQVGNGGWGLGIGQPNANFQSPGPNPHRLYWNIREQAELLGLDAIRLGFRAHLHPHTIAALWRGTAQAVSLDTLGKTAAVLGQTQPFSIGQLFVWQECG